MIIPKNSRFPNSIRHFAGLSAQSFIWAACLLFGLACSGQTFTTIDLPALSADATHGGALNYTVTSAGDLLYGNDATLYEQSAFGSSTITSFTDSPDVDPSFIAAVSPTLAVVGTGEFGSTPIYTFNPSTLNTSFTALTSLQNYMGAAASPAALFVVGTNGTGGANSVSYVTTSGAQQLLVDQAGSFSAGIAIDPAGNLYVADNDNDNIYKFTSVQVNNAINLHAPLNLLADGALVHTFAAGTSSIAVDGHGVLYASGYDINGNGLISYFNPATNIAGTLNPEAAGEVIGNFPTYDLQSFNIAGTDYISYVWQAGFNAGDQVVYGYAVVPEPAAYGWLASILVLGYAFYSRLRSKQFRS